MKTVVLGPRPAELDAVIARRHALGQDTHDEVWEGDYHMAPASHHWHGIVSRQLAFALESHVVRAGLHSSDTFNLGRAGNYRVPDGGIHRRVVDSVWLDTAAMVIEVVSPGDESWNKFDFYASHAVDEVLVADPAARSIAIFVLRGDAYERTDHSVLLGVTAAELVDAITWPAG